MTPEQRKQLEDQLAASKANAANDSLHFSLPDLGSIPDALVNVGSSVVDAGKSLFSQAAHANDPIFKVRKLAETQADIKEMEALIKRDEDMKAKYKGFDPLNQNLDQFQTLAMSQIPGTPLLAPWDENTPDTTKMSIKAKIGSKVAAALPNTPIPVQQAPEVSRESKLFDLLTQANKPNTAYEDALNKQEEGNRLAVALSGAAQIGRAIAGQGRLSESTDTFKDVAGLYGDDKRIMDESAKRAEVDETLSAMQADSNISRAAQVEAEALLKDIGKDLKDPEALARMSAKQLAPLLLSLRADKTALEAKQDKEAKRVLDEQKYKDEIAYKKEWNNLQRDMFTEGVNSRQQIAQWHNEAEKEKALTKKQTDLESQYDKDAKALNKDLDKGWASRSGAGVVQQKIVQAEAAEVLLEQGRHQPGGLDSRQIEELAQTTARLLGGGASASARVEALIPHTWLGKAQTLNEFISNSPQGAEQQEFVARMAETVDREKKKAMEQKSAYQTELLPAHSRLKKTNPELFDSILDGKHIPQKYWAQPPEVSETAKAPSFSADTMNKINSRSEEENIERLKVLKAKYGTK